jgi:Tol biopolymer transport system component
MSGKYAIAMIDLKTKKSNVIKYSDQKISQINWVGTSLFFMKNDGVDNLETFNLYLLNPLSLEQKTISQIASPGSVSSFSVSENSGFITFDVLKDQTSDLFLVKNDGTNLVQITKDGQSFAPLFLPGSTQIVFGKINQGLFKINIDINNFPTIKLIDFKDKINKIYTWR